MNSEATATIVVFKGTFGNSGFWSSQTIKLVDIFKNIDQLDALTSPKTTISKCAFNKHHICCGGFCIHIVATLGAAPTTPHFMTKPQTVLYLETLLKTGVSFEPDSFAIHVIPRDHPQKVWRLMKAFLTVVSR